MKQILTPVFISNIQTILTAITEIL